MSNSRPVSHVFPPPPARGPTQRPPVPPRQSSLRVPWNWADLSIENWALPTDQVEVDEEYRRAIAFRNKRSAILAARRTTVASEDTLFDVMAAGNKGEMGDETTIVPRPNRRWRSSKEDVGAYVGDCEGLGTALSPFIVDFNEGDPTNPQNFSATKKWTILVTVGSATFCVAFGSSLYVGGITGMIETFGESEVITLFGLSLYVLGFGFGPMAWAPASEIWGRRPVFLCTFFPFFLFQIGCARAGNIETLIVLRFLAGAIGSSPLTNSAGVIVDTFNSRERGPAMALYALMPFLGPVIGPIVGGFIGEINEESWRWLFWILCIYSCACLIGGFFVPETHAPVILRQRAKLLSQQTGKVYRSVHDLTVDVKESSTRKLKTYMVRPFVLLFTEPIVFLFAIYASIIYGILYISFGSYPVIFGEDRGWTAGMAGLPFIAIGFGMFLGIVAAVFDNIRYLKQLKDAGGVLPPEERLRVCCMGAILLPISLAWLAASAKADVHWIVPTLAGVPFGGGMLMVFMGGTSYLVETYSVYAASAMAANSFMRSLFAAGFPLFTEKMFHGLGASWAVAILAFVCLVCAPLPFWFFATGSHIRERSGYSKTA